MALVLGCMGSARRDGYTIGVLEATLHGADSVDGVETELIRLLDHSFGPCTSCYECIRMPEHRCILPDDMGRRGSGALWQRVETANALVLATPVHGWMADALIHLFAERLYPFLWSGELKGIPVGTLAVASNQGFQDSANRMLCQLAFTMGAHYVGGLSVHAAYMRDALQQAEYLGIRLGEAALADERMGRRAMSDQEIWAYYADKPWSVYPEYLANLTLGTGDPRLSVMQRALATDAFHRPAAVELLRRAQEAFEDSSRSHALGNTERALKCLVRASALWTHATWSEFLEESLIKAPPPDAYRPLGDDVGPVESG